MYRDMTRGSITRGLLLFALPMAAGDPCGAGLCAGGAGGRQRNLGRYPYRLVSGGCDRAYLYEVFILQRWDRGLTPVSQVPLGRRCQTPVPRRKNLMQVCINYLTFA